MPIPQIVRIDPRDLDKNRAIGVSLPFNGGGVFNSTFSTQDQIKSNLINLLLTYKGERVLNPEFGADLPRLLFEPMTNELIKKIQDQIINNVNIYVPEIILTNIIVTPDIDRNTLYVMIEYQLKISGNQDKIIIDFSTLK
jgi:phage baseplate assembly protein W